MEELQKYWEAAPLFVVIMGYILFTLGLSLLERLLWVFLRAGYGVHVNRGVRNVNLLAYRQSIARYRKALNKAGVPARTQAVYLVLLGSAAWLWLGIFLLFISWVGWSAYTGNLK